jgi:hypothetical protein
MDELEARLSATLRKSAAATGDAGFSDAVMRSLPARRRLASAGARRWTLAGAAVAGGSVAASLGLPTLTMMAAVLFAAGLAATTYWVFWSE